MVAAVMVQKYFNRAATFSSDVVRGTFLPLLLSERVAELFFGRIDVALALLA
jgi:hypothetical protein